MRFYLRFCDIFQYNPDNHQKDSYDRKSSEPSPKIKDVSLLPVYGFVILRRNERTIPCLRTHHQLMYQTTLPILSAFARATLMHEHPSHVSYVVSCRGSRHRRRGCPSWRPRACEAPCLLHKQTKKNILICRVALLFINKKGEIML